MKKCKTTGCAGTAAEHSKSGLCILCRSSLYYWAEKSIQQMEERLERLERWQGRLRYFTTMRRPGKVVQLRPRRRA